MRDQVAEHQRDGTPIDMTFVYWPWSAMIVQTDRPRLGSSQCTCRGPCTCRNRRGSVTTDTRGYRISCNEDRTSRMHVEKEQMVGNHASKPQGYMRFASLFS